MLRKSKVAVMHIINAYALGGAEKLVFDIARRMDKTKFNVFVCSIGAREDDIEQAVRHDLQSQGIKTLSLDKPPHKQRVHTVVKLAKILCDNKIDILHTHCPSPDFYGKLSALIARIPLVFSTIHNTQGYSASVERVLSRLTTKYVAISKTVAQYALQELKIPSQKIEIIYNAIDVRQFTETHNQSIIRKKKRTELGIPENIQMIMTIGRITRQKGHIYLIDAMKEVVKNFPNVCLCIVGDYTCDPDVTNELKRKVKESGLKEKVIWTGVRTDIPELLASADIFVLPSLWEGLPVTLLEAMASRIPVVATAVGSNPEIIRHGENGFLVPPANPSTLAKCILELLKDKKKAQLLAEEGYKTIQERFTIERMVKEYEKLYLKFIN